MQANSTIKSPYMAIVLGLVGKIFPESENNVWEDGDAIRPYMPDSGFVYNNTRSHMFQGSQNPITRKLTSLSPERLIETVIEFTDGGFSNGLGLKHGFTDFLAQLDRLSESSMATKKIQTRLKELTQLCEILDQPENYLTGHRINLTAGWVHVVLEIQCPGVKLVIDGQYHAHATAPVMEIRYPYMITPALLSALHPRVEIGFGNMDPSGLRVLVDGKWVVAVSSSWTGSDTRSLSGMSNTEGRISLGVLATRVQLELCDQVVAAMAQSVWVTRVVQVKTPVDSRLMVSFEGGNKYQISLEFGNV